MNFLVEYQTFVFILSVIGVYPFRVNRKAQSVQYSSKIFIYSVSTNLILLPTAIGLLVYRIITSLESLIYVEFVANFLIDSLTVIVYFVIVFVCIKNRELHMKFLNDIQHFDLNICQQIKFEMIQECFCLRRNILFSILFSVSYFLLTCITDYMLRQEDGSPNTDIFFRVLLALMLQSMCLVALHLRSCALLLIMRFRIVSMRLSNSWYGNTETNMLTAKHGWECESLLGIFEYLFDMSDQFEDIFGIILLLNIILDQLQITITVFMLTMLSFFRKGLSWESFTMTFVAYLLMPATKMFVLMTVVDKLGHQVNILHYSSK